jgi:hypothetical protein
MRIINKITVSFLLLNSITIGQTLSLFEYSDLEFVKVEFVEHGRFKTEINNLKFLADEAIEESPYTITKYSAPSVEGATINDYYSDSPYWWPVEGNPDAPYLRKDGERNPDRFMDHKVEVAKFYKGVLSITFYSHFTDDSDYRQKANDILKIWFIDNETKMNPNLKYSQLIRNRTKPRGVGIIDGRRLAFLTEAIILLKVNDQLEEDVYEGIKEWYSELLNWLTTSYYGLDEKQRGNNHGTWWAAQVAAISSFLQNEDEIRALDGHSKHYLLDNQIDENARQPLEEKRTRSLSYSAFNVTAHSYLNAIFLKNEIDNWSYINKNGVTLIDVIDYLIPFVKNPSDWKLKQIKSLDNSSPLFLGFAGLQLNNIEYLKVYNELSDYDDDNLDKPTFDPFQIVLDSVVKLKLAEFEKRKTLLLE